MTIKELKEKLNHYPDDMRVIMSRDSEGNSYSPLSDLDEVYYIEDELELAWTEEDYEEMIKEEYSEEYDSYEDYLNREGAVKCVSLWPIH